MGIDRVSAQDSVGVELIKSAPAPKPAALLCPECGSATIEVPARTDWRACVNTECLHTCRVGACITALPC